MSGEAGSLRPNQFLGPRSRSDRNNKFREEARLGSATRTW